MLWPLFSLFFVIFPTVPYSSSDDNLLLGCLLSWLLNSCIWANYFILLGWGRWRRAGIEPGAAVQLPGALTTELCRTLLSYAAPYWATPHLSKLHRTLLSYAAPFWVTPRPSELSPHPTELRRTPLVSSGPWKVRRKRLTKLVNLGKRSIYVAK